MLNKTAIKTVLIAGALLIATAARAQEQSQKNRDQNGITGMDMGDAQKQASPEARAANDAMSGSMSDHDMDMGAHMFMTDLRPANAADQKRAAEILAELRPAIEKYRDYKVALAEGFQIFFPNVPQEHYHFTNYRYGFEAQFGFNPEHPTSLLYKKGGRRLPTRRRDVYGAEAGDGRRAERARAIERGALAQACEFLHAAKRNGMAAGELEAVWDARDDFNGSRVRAGGRRVAGASFRMDGARLPV